MARITLEYNARNQTANRIIDIILAMDNVFKVKEGEKHGSSLTRKAIKEAENGKTITCDSYEEYLKKTSGHA